MQIIRTIFWVVIAALLVTFIMLNLTPVPVILSPKGLWLLSKASRWRLKRRIASLENSVRAAMPTPPLAPHTADDHADIGENPPHAEG